MRFEHRNPLIPRRWARLWYLAPLMPPTTPERFGDYELVERLGVGGMAETFVAVRRGPGGFEQRVCLKRILPTFAQRCDTCAADANRSTLD